MTAEHPHIRFRRAYWQAFRELDVVRVQRWGESNLTLPQLRVLFELRREPGVTTTELARRLGTTASTTSGLVIKLEERALVERRRAPGDRRREPLVLTAAGAAVVGGMSEHTRPFLDRVAGGLGSDLDRVTEALERVAAVAGLTRAADEGADDLGGADRSDVERGDDEAADAS